MVFGNTTAYKDDYVVKNKKSPPCCKFRVVREWLEHSLTCRKFGKIGHREFTERFRTRACQVSLACSIISLLLTMVAMMGFNAEAVIVRALNWSNSKVETGTDANQASFYYGLSGYAQYTVIDNGPEIESFVAWTDAQCFVHPHHDCQACEGATGTSYALIITALFWMIPQLMTDINRMSEETDLNCFKMTGVFWGGFLGMLWQALALIIFTMGCFLLLESDSPSGDFVGPVKNNFGTGWFCLLVATSLRIISITIHALLVCPEFCHEGFDRGDADFDESGDDDLDIEPFDDGNL